MKGENNTYAVLLNFTMPANAKRFNEKKNKVLSRNFFLFFSIPVLTLIIFMMVNIFVNIKNTKKTTEQAMELSFKNFSAYCDDKIYSIADMYALLNTHERITQILQSRDPITEEDIPLLLNYLKSFEKISPLIAESAILSQNNDTVITTDGKYTFNEYFGGKYVMKQYSSDYFRAYDIYDGSAYKTLPPCTAVKASNTNMVIPIIIRRTVGRNEKLIFLAIYLDKIFENTSNSLANSEIYVLDNYTAMSYSSVSKTSKNIADTQLYEKLIRKNTSFETIDEDGRNCTVFSYKPVNTLLGYTYYITIPNTEFYKKQSSGIAITIISTVFAILIAVSVLFKNSSSLLHSLNKITSKLNVPTSKTSSILSDIMDGISNISDQNKYYMSLAQEFALISFLNNPHTTAESENLLAELPLKRKYFISFILQLSTTPQFDDEFKNENCEVLIKSIFSVLKSILANSENDEVNVFFISVEKNTLYAIINGDDKDYVENYAQSSKATIIDILKQDSPLVDLFIGIGSAEANFDGLHLSHNNAVKNMINEFQPMQSKPTKKDLRLNTYSYKIEQKLFPALIKNDIDEAKEIIDDLFNPQNTKLSKLDKKRLYSHIFDTIFRVVRIKNVTLPTELSENSVRDRLSEEPDEAIYKSFILIINSLAVKKKTADKNELIEFINENFTNCDLSLEMICQAFNIPSSSCSKLLRSALNMGFHKYLSILRTENAKKMLTETDLPVQEILEKSGFTNRQTFTRVFKNQTGLSPTEYRNSMKNK